MYMKYTYTCHYNLWYTFEMIVLENRSNKYLKSSQLWSLGVYMHVKQKCMYAYKYVSYRHIHTRLTFRIVFISTCNTIPKYICIYIDWRYIYIYTCEYTYTNVGMSGKSKPSRKEPWPLIRTQLPQILVSGYFYLQRAYSFNQTCFAAYRNKGYC